MKKWNKWIQPFQLFLVNYNGQGLSQFYYTQWNHILVKWSIYQTVSFPIRQITPFVNEFLSGKLDSGNTLPLFHVHLHLTAFSVVYYIDCFFHTRNCKLCTKESINILRVDKKNLLKISDVIIHYSYKYLSNFTFCLCKNN